MSFPKKCIIVDVGNERIKLADVVRSNKDIKVVRSSIVETPKGCLDDGMIIDMESITESINKGIVDLRTKTKEIVFIVASSKIITREVSFPDVNNKKLRSIVEMNAGEYFPVNLDEYTIDFNIVERVEERGEKSVNVTIVAALSSLVNQYVFLAKECGVHLVGIDYSGNSLGSFAKYESINGANIVVDIGSRSTMVNIVDNGVIKFSRNLLYGTNAVVEAIAESFDVDYEEAISISKDRPLLNTNNEENPFLKNDVSDAMNDVLNGISRLVDYYTSRNEIKFDQIVLVGGGATIYGLQDYMESYFSMDTVILDDFKIVSQQSDIEFIRDSIFFANVLGACYSEINLLPKKIAQKAVARTNSRLEILLLLLVVVALATLTFVKVSSITSLRNEKISLTSELEESKKVIVIKEEWVKFKEQVSFRQDLMKESGDISEKIDAVFASMEEFMPTDVFVISIVDSGDSITMGCVARDKMVMAKFIETMKLLEAYSFTRVFVPSVSEQVLDAEDIQLIEDVEETEGVDIVFDDKYYEFTIILQY